MWFLLEWGIAVGMEAVTLPGEEAFRLGGKVPSILEGKTFVG